MMWAVAAERRNATSPQTISGGATRRASRARHLRNRWPLGSGTPTSKYTVEAVARGRGVSVDTIVIDAPQTEIQRVERDKAFMTRLGELTARDREILDRLAQ